jgi:transposase-like protein
MELFVLDVLKLEREYGQGHGNKTKAMREVAERHGIPEETFRKFVGRHRDDMVAFVEQALADESRPAPDLRDYAAEMQRTRDLFANLQVNPSSELRHLMQGLTDAVRLSPEVEQMLQAHAAATKLPPELQQALQSITDVMKAPADLMSRMGRFNVPD